MDAMESMDAIQKMALDNQKEMRVKLIADCNDYLDKPVSSDLEPLQKIYLGIRAVISQLEKNGRNEEAQKIDSFYKHHQPSLKEYWEKSEEEKMRIAVGAHVALKAFLDRFQDVLK
jgi:hypothetical protein